MSPDTACPLPAPALDQPAGPALLQEMLPHVYDELRSLAANYLRGERTNHTLQPTALVHEAYLRLLDQHSVAWENRAQFLGVAARTMRRILSTHAAARAAGKRGGGEVNLGLETALDVFEQRGVSAVVLDEVLQDLEKLDPRQARIVDLRFFVGLTIEETATILDISPATVKREWTIAKLWLQREMSAA